MAASITHAVYREPARTSRACVPVVGDTGQQPSRPTSSLNLALRYHHVRFVTTIFSVKFNVNYRDIMQIVCGGNHKGGKD